MLERVRIIKELGVLVAIVLDWVIFLIAHAVRKVVGDAVAVADVSLVTERFNFTELGVLVQDHDRGTKGNRVEQEPDDSACDAKTHFGG